MIGKALAQSRTKPLNVTEFFNMPNPSAILLYTNYVPFELILNVKTEYDFIPGPLSYQWVLHQHMSYKKSLPLH